MYPATASPTSSLAGSPAAISSRTDEEDTAILSIFSSVIRGCRPALSAAAVEYVFSLGKSSDVISSRRGLKQRLLNLAVPEDTIAMIEKSGVAPLTFVWTAPSDGIVFERNVVDGMRAQPGDILFRDRKSTRLNSSH